VTRSRPASSTPRTYTGPQDCLFDRVTPECLRTAYGLNSTSAGQPASSNAQAVIVNQHFKPADLASFEQKHGLPAQPVAKLIGQNDDTAGDEASLDLQFIIAMGQLVPTYWVYINGHVANPFASWITWASNTSDLPHVHSLSVGEPEGDFARDNGGEIAIQRMNDEMAALGARGVSLVFASGDSGFAAQQKYPAASPVVTSVGGVTLGTVFKEDGITVDGETTGGFSSLASNGAQTYQHAAVDHFLHDTTGSRPQHNLNASRRCVPDLAAYSTEFYIVQDGSETVIGGTSAAAPVVAGMLSLINDALIAAGHTPLGFANPFLYANADAFLDVTRGGNRGYDAVQGYDPASGLGTFSPTTFATLRDRALAGRAALAASKPPTTLPVPIAIDTPLATASSQEMDASQLFCGAGRHAGELLVGLRVPAHGRAELERRFWATAEPGASEYRRHHQQPSELRNVLGAEARDVQRVVRWLETLGADAANVQLTPTGDALRARCHYHTTTDRPPKQPVDLPVDFVVLLKPCEASESGCARPPHNATGGVGRSASSSSAQPHARNGGAMGIDRAFGMGASFGPTAQKAAYNVPADLKGSAKENWQMVFGTGTFGYRTDDLSLFFRQYAPSSSVDDVALDVHNVWHGATGENFAEGTLDASYAAAFAPGVRTVVANTNTSAATENGEAFGGALLSFLIDLNGRSSVPLVLSMSLGSLSFGSCDKMCTALAAQGAHSYAACWDYLQSQHQACMFGSAAIEDRIDAELMKLGLRGVTVVAASGDGGSHFAFGPFSGEIGGALDTIICGSMHMPVYPTASPYLLSVGGTEWSADTMYGPTCSADKPCGWSGGGGGFSWATSAPAYQRNVTAAYITAAGKLAPSTFPTAGSFNGAGRGYPDLAALAQFGIPLCTYGGCSGSGGTSASAPTVAGMLSLVNDARLDAGKPPLGFVNTRLYSLMADPKVAGECFADVAVDQVGSLWDCPNFSTCQGCDDGGGHGRGFVPTRGWDAQTGWGQPLFDGLKRHLVAD